jgi:non-ribosomal peptide synthetase-like protein
MKPWHRPGGGGDRASSGVDGIERVAAHPSVLSCGTNGAIRWTRGERLHHLFEQACLRFGGNDAVVTDDAVVTYRELDRRANQVARHLIDQGLTAGDRVGLLFDKSVETYVALLAVLKINAAYVPLDCGFPIERLRFIVGDAELKAIVSMSSFAAKLAALDIKQLFLDLAAPDIAARPSIRLAEGETALAVDQVCYIIYTSGTTGNPKGVVIEHPSICNFVRVAAERYGYAPGDRVYQGMTIAFDFAVEEVWVPLMAGATLVPGRPGGSLLGEELADFLHQRRVTCLACCPTLLSTIERDLPDLRLLLVGGEACPHNLVVRWHRQGRTILNSYGPTEATVTATVTELTPDKPVTIGVPLPTYSIVILDPAADRAVALGELGEIGIAGIGVAAGYLNRDELTRTKFIHDFLDIPNNPSGRIYRTGDLGRITEHGEIDYRGRIDTQVKIRGYRIELNEIEAVMLELPQVAQAAVTTFEPEPGMVEIAAYYALKQGAGELSRNDITRLLKSRLPAYMVPAYLEQLAVIPMTLSNKADHKKLPKPQAPRFSAGHTLVAAKTETEHLLAVALGDVLKLERVSTDQHFFDDLGANSLLMARFCARIRHAPGTSNVSMRDIYLNPTIAKLADHLDHAVIEGFIAKEPEPFHTPSDFAYYSCGALQLLFYGVYGLLGFWVFDVGLDWIDAAGADLGELYLRSVAFAVSSFALFCAIPIAAKWLLVGRWKAQSIPIWSLGYFRFWMVKTLVRSAPVVVFIGTPLYNFYLRLLGAKIGRHAVVGCRFVPACTDLISIGDHTVLRKDSILLGYRAQSNFIHIGPVEIGSHAFVGEASVLDIDTAMGNHTQLGHASSLQSGQSIPDGKRYHGSPAVETSSDYCPIENVECSSLRRGLYEAFQLAALFAVAVPVPLVALAVWDQYSAGSADTAATGFALLSIGLFFGSLVAALAGVYLVPRLCNLFLKADKTYPLFGFHYWLQTAISEISNARFFHVLFGDSCLIVRHIRLLGWNLNKVQQTGSNFGTNQKHDNPVLCDIGSGTMVSDGLSMINMQMSSSSFRLAMTRIGDANYLGNNIYYPPGGRTGANCLLGTKVMIPVDGPVRENVGLLGSPCFEIPRMVDRDRDLCDTLGEDERPRRLRQKNLHNSVTAALFLLNRWMFFVGALIAWQVAHFAYPRFGVLALFATSAVLSVVAVLFFAMIERTSLRFRRLEPKMVTIYDRDFWAHERHWKLSDTPIMQLFAGTPFKNLISWMVGVKIGRKVYDANCSITERTLTEIGDYANLNEGSVLQAHSLEEGVFKSDFIRIGTGCTLGPAAFVHYGATLGDHVVIDADSFLMKGETLDPHTRWCGNPAKMVRGGTMAVADTHCVTAPAVPASAPRLAAE